jgi:hypothetical protein
MALMKKYPHSITYGLLLSLYAAYGTYFYLVSSSTGSFFFCYVNSNPGTFLLGNSAIFSIATFTYFYPARGNIEIAGKFFDLCAFTCVAFSDAIPDPLRLYFHRAFLPLFIFLHAAVLFPRLYWDLDDMAQARCASFGSEEICNTTLACQVLMNLLIWHTYIALNSAFHPDSFHLVLARVRVNEKYRRAALNIEM